MNCKDPRTLIGPRQYVKVIEPLRTRVNDLDDTQSSDLAQLTCLLLICLGMMRSQRVAALSHLGTGLKILSPRAKHFQHAPNALVLQYDPEGTVDQLISIFARLDYDCTLPGQRCPHSCFFRSRAPYGEGSFWLHSRIL